MSEIPVIPVEQTTEQREKPAFVYHASEQQGVEEFEPRSESVRDPNEGPVVFATPDRAYALQFLVPGDNRDSKRGYYNGIPTIVIRGSLDDFVQRDKGGYLYQLPSETFDFDPTKPMGNREWTSRASVKPIQSEHCPSTIDALIEAGVQVYFVNDAMFAKIRSEKNAGFETLLTLTSENMRQGKNVRKYRKE